MSRHIVGRDAELAALEHFVAGSGDERVAAVEGEAGMGKTTLWRAAVEYAMEHGSRVLVSRPTEAEASFAYACLADLLEGVPDQVHDALPTPQRRALRVALLLDEPVGPTPDARAVAAAFMNTLRTLARDQPVLVAVDDPDWLDPATATVLAFAWRRLGDERLRLVFARRLDASRIQQSGLIDSLMQAASVRIRLRPLSPPEIRSLLHERLGLSLSAAALARLHATAGGNPFFSLELGRALRDRGAAADWDEDWPIPDSLSRLIGGQLDALPQETQDALAAAAYAAAPTLEIVSRATGRPAETTLLPAVTSGIATVDELRIRFTHPLRAATVRARLSPEARRAVHHRLGLAISDPDERAWHQGLATSGPDETVAAALAEAAGRAAARGSPEVAAEFARAAVSLTPADRPDEHRRRTLALANYLWISGDFEQGHQLAADLIATCPPGPARTQLLTQLGGTNVLWGLLDRVDLLREAIDQAKDDPRARMRLEGVLTGHLDQWGGDVREALAHGYAELELAERLGDEVHIATALRGIARNEQRLSGRLPTALIERAVALEPQVAAIRTVNEWPTVCLAEMLSWTDDLAAGLQRWDWLAAQADELGPHARLDVDARSMPYRCMAGDWDEVCRRADEGLELLSADGTFVRANLIAGRALAEAHLGDEAPTRHDVAEAAALESRWDISVALRTAAWALGLLELSLGHHAAAHEQLGPIVASRRAAGVGEPGDMRFVTDEIEALIGLGRSEEAEAMLDWYEGLARSSGRVFALAACERARGLLAAEHGDLAAAITTLELSQAAYATIVDPFGLGRTLLALGTVQRRALHRREARQTLEASLTAFQELGARLWAARARAELSRIGGRRPVGNELSPAEREVAALVAQGHTNREVAVALVLSERTVEGHLSTIYAKLQIRSRSELARALASETDPRS